MEVQNNTSTNGVGLSTVVFIVFLVLKLVGVIHWSWWWITAPIWSTFLLLVAVYVIIFLSMQRKYK